MRKVTVVCGPPGSGKNFYVEAHRNTEDVVIDYDAIMSAITGLPLHEHNRECHWLVWDAMQAMYNRISRPDTNLLVWVISTAPTDQARRELRHRLKADLIELDTPIEICRERLLSRPNQSNSMASMDWYLQHSNA